MLTNDGSYCIKDMKTVEEAGKGEIVIGPLLMSNIPEKNQLQLNVVRLGIMRKSEKKEEAEAHSQIMAWIAAGALKPSDFISNVFEFDHILDAFGLVEKRLPDTKKVVIRYS